MTDFFLRPAQTNLDLYEQAIAREYPRSERERLADAYLFALRQVFPLARGSGKPFICHLVGVASLVLASGCPPDWVIAALLHALYQRRIPFQHGLSPEERRAVVSSRFGADVDDLVYRYTDFETVDLVQLAPEELSDRSDVTTVRLADELEDLYGYALALHGTPESDAAEIPGTFVRRRASKTAERQRLLAVAHELGLTGIARGLEHWLDFPAMPVALSDMRTGWFSSIDLSSDDNNRGR